MFRKYEPIFIKESSDAERHIEEMRQFLDSVSEDQRSHLQRDIMLLEYGIQGEKNIDYELSNSHMPLVIIKDYAFECEGTITQIDYLVFTEKLMFVIECKNLFGNIEINAQGDFVRTLNYKNRTVKEGIYSPITQNQKHFEMLRKRLLNKRQNVLFRFLTDRSFDSFCVPVVVLANPKTVVNMKYAKKDVKAQVIRADQLIEFIKEKNKQSKTSSFSYKDTLKWAESYLSDCIEKPNTFLDKYKANIEEAVTVSENQSLESIETSEVYLALKEYRLTTSKNEGIKAYYIFNNAQMSELVMLNPQTLDALGSISWMTSSKMEKYGDAILQILMNYHGINRTQ